MNAFVGTFIDKEGLKRLVSLQPYLALPKIFGTRSLRPSGRSAHVDVLMTIGIQDT